MLGESRSATGRFARLGALVAVLAWWLAGPARAADQTVTITDTGYDKVIVSIGMGDQVEWVNDTGSRKTLVFANGQLPAVTVEAGKKASKTFRQAGTFVYSAQSPDQGPTSSTDEVPGFGTVIVSGSSPQPTPTPSASLTPSPAASLSPSPRVTRTITPLPASPSVAAPSPSPPAAAPSPPPSPTAASATTPNPSPAPSPSRSAAAAPASGGPGGGPSGTAIAAVAGLLLAAGAGAGLLWLRRGPPPPGRPPR